MSHERNDAAEFPETWRAAFERDRQGALRGNDPAPERRAGRVLAAFVLAGLAFVLLPGTLLGVWNLLTISSRQASTGASTAWIQAHGQAQLLGWVGTFILGISLYVLPKFLGRFLTRFGLVWTVWGLWTAGAAWHWWAGVGESHWRVGLVGSAVLELGAFLLAQYLLWFERSSHQAGAANAGSRKSFPGDLASWLGVTGFAAFGVALLLNLGIAIFVARRQDFPTYPALTDRTFLVVTLWGFVIPVAWGYSTRFVTVFVGLQKSEQRAARWLAAGVVVLVLAALAQRFLVADVAALLVSLGAIWALRVFLPATREAKRADVYPNYPFFIRVCYTWLLLGAALGVLADLAPRLTGLEGASRHALTVGFVAALIFCVGPLILPAFLNGRELWSPRVMGASLWILNLGCFLRVSSEGVAYSAGGLAWKVLPVSALLELTAVFLFVLNLGMTLAQPMPAWFSPGGVAPTMPLYFYITSFPKTKPLLVEAGLKTLGWAREVPRTLSLAEAAETDGADLEKLLAELRTFFAQRQPRRQGKS